jgi:hypothetical protein
MCKWGNNKLCRVNIPSALSHTGKPRWEIKGIDSCIANIVNALNQAKIFTDSSCCGHGKEFGHIWLRDGRILVILPGGLTKDKICKILESKNLGAK